MLGRPPFSFYGRYTTKKKIPVDNEPTRRRFLREPGEDTDSTCLLQRSVYTIVFRPSVTLLHVDLKYIHDKRFIWWSGESQSICCTRKHLNLYAYWKLRLSSLLFSPLSSAEAPAGYPNNDSNNRKTESARRTMGRRKRRESLLPSSSFPSRPARFLFLSPRPHYDTKESLSKGVFERRTSTGSEAFSLLTCLDDIKFVFLSFFTVIEAIWQKIWAKPPFKNEKRPLPVSVRHSKMSLFRSSLNGLCGRESFSPLVSALHSWSLRCTW